MLIHTHIHAHLNLIELITFYLILSIIIIMIHPLFPPGAEHGLTELAQELLGAKADPNRKSKPMQRIPAVTAGGRESHGEITADRGKHRNQWKSKVSIWEMAAFSGAHTLPSNGIC